MASQQLRTPVHQVKFGLNSAVHPDDGTLITVATETEASDINRGFPSFVQAAFNAAFVPPLTCQAPRMPELHEMLFADLPEGMVVVTGGDKTILQLRPPPITPTLSRKQLRFRMDVYQFLSGRLLQEEIEPKKQFWSGRTKCTLTYQCRNCDTDSSCPFRLVYEFVHVVPNDEHSIPYDTEFGIKEYRKHQCLPPGGSGALAKTSQHDEIEDEVRSENSNNLSLDGKLHSWGGGEDDCILTLRLSSAIVACHCLRQGSIPMLEGTTNEEEKEAITAQVGDELGLSLSAERAYTGYCYFEYMHFRRNSLGALPSVEDLWMGDFCRKRWTGKKPFGFGFPRLRYTDDAWWIKLCKVLWCILWCPIWLCLVLTAFVVFWVPFMIFTLGPANMAFAETGIPREKQIMEEYERDGTSTIAHIFNHTVGISAKWWAVFIPYHMFCPCWTMNTAHTFDFTYQLAEVDESGCRLWLTKRCFSYNGPDCDSIPILVLPGKASSGYPTYLIDSGARKYSHQVIWFRWLGGLVASALLGAAVVGLASLARDWRVTGAAGLSLLVWDVFIYCHYKARFPRTVENKIVDGSFFVALSCFAPFREVPKMVMDGMGGGQAHLRL